MPLRARQKAGVRGPTRTVEDTQRFSRHAKSGVFERIFRLLASDHDNKFMMIDANS